MPNSIDTAKLQLERMRTARGHVNPSEADEPRPAVALRSDPSRDSEPNRLKHSQAHRVNPVALPQGLVLGMAMFATLAASSWGLVNFWGRRTFERHLAEELRAASTLGKTLEGRMLQLEQENAALRDQAVELRQDLHETRVLLQNLDATPAHKGSPDPLPDEPSPAL